MVSTNIDRDPPHPPPELEPDRERIEPTAAGAAAVVGLPVVGLLTAGVLMVRLLVVALLPVVVGSAWLRR
jgi:hypothetical protein